MGNRAADDGPRTPIGVRFAHYKSQEWLASLAHPWLISEHAYGVRQRSPEGCREISPGLSEAKPGVGILLRQRTPEGCEDRFGRLL